MASVLKGKKPLSFLNPFLTIENDGLIGREETIPKRADSGCETVSGISYLSV